MALEIGKTRFERAVYGGCGVLAGLATGVVMAVTKSITAVGALMAVGFIVLGIALIDPKLGRDLLDRAKGLRSGSSA